MKAKFFGTALLCVFYMNGMQRLVQVIVKMCSKEKKRIHSVSNTIAAAAATINTLRVDFVRFVSGQPLEHLSHYFHTLEVAAAQGAPKAIDIAKKQQQVMKRARHPLACFKDAHKKRKTKIGQDLSISATIFHRIKHPLRML